MAQQNVNINGEEFFPSSSGKELYNQIDECKGILVAC